MTRPPSSLGPITQTILEGEHGEAPALIREWYDSLKHPHDMVFFWTAASRPWSSTGLYTCIHGSQEDATTHPIIDADTDAISEALESVLHGDRLRVLQALHHCPQDAPALASRLRIRQGKLNRHLSDLFDRGYVHKGEETYELTGLGRRILVLAVFVGHQVLEGQAASDEGGQWHLEEWSGKHWLRNLARRLRGRHTAEASSTS